MYEILLSIDRNVERAVAAAEAVTELPAAAEEVRVVCLHVFTENPEGASVHRIEAVRRAREVLEEAGVRVELAEESGDPSTRVLDEARERDVDAIAIAGRKRTPAGKAVFGSVTQEVILNADRPVFVCPQTS